MECEAFCCVCVCLCLCLSLYGREVTVGYGRLRGGMGATFCHLAAVRLAIEFLFWDHWGTAVLVQILAGRSREQISAIWRPLGRRLNFSSGIIGTQPCGRSLEVTGGYGGGKRRKVEEWQEKGRRKAKKMRQMSSVKWKVWNVECKV